jgi:uncharacterized protein (DUF427 family)
MAIHRSQSFMRETAQLRYEPVQKRVRARSGGRVWADSRRAALVWEPRRVVPSYALPIDDVDAALSPAPAVGAEERPVRTGHGGPPVFDPRTAFAVHTCEGDALSLSANGTVLDGAAFRPADPDLRDYLVLDFAAFDDWRDEEEPVIGHPRDPFHRIDILRSSRRVQIALDGEEVADTTGARLLFETLITPRFYLRREDVRMERLAPSATRTICAYKGHASYWSLDAGGRQHPDMAWTYEQPLSDARDVAGLIAFFDERMDVTLDGEPRKRPVTPWS